MILQRREANTLCCILFTGIIVNSCTMANTATGQQRSSASLNLALEEAMGEYAFTREKLDQFEGKKVDVLLANGDEIENLVVTGFSAARGSNLVKSIKVKPQDGGREKNFLIKQVYQLEIGELEYPLKYIPSKRASVVFDIPRRNKDINVRLRAQRDAVWETYDEATIKKFVEQEKEFLEKVGEHFTRLPMKVYETKYFLFYTNMPPNQIAPFLRNLDAMNEQLGTAFGFPPGRNIWKGKAVVVAFIEERDFIEFETKFMEYPVAPSSFQALCHSFRNGSVIVGCWRGDDPIGFATTLVHETAHGYVHRYMTSAPVLSWLNEGIADWIAQAAVARSTQTRIRQEMAAQRVRQLGGLDASYFGVTTETIDGWHYGVASSIVQILLDAGPGNFRLFIDGIKEGRTWEESLQRAYRLTPQQLIAYYNRSVGVVRPRTR